MIGYFIFIFIFFVLAVSFGSKALQLHALINSDDSQADRVSFKNCLTAFLISLGILLILLFMVIS